MESEKCLNCRAKDLGFWICSYCGHIYWQHLITTSFIFSIFSFFLIVIHLSQTKEIMSAKLVLLIIFGSITTISGIVLIIGIFIISLVKIRLKKKGNPFKKKDYFNIGICNKCGVSKKVFDHIFYYGKLQTSQTSVDIDRVTKKNTYQILGNKTINICKECIKKKDKADFFLCLIIGVIGLGVSVPIFLMSIFKIIPTEFFAKNYILAAILAIVLILSLVSVIYSFKFLLFHNDGNDFAKVILNKELEELMNENKIDNIWNEDEYKQLIK